MEAIWTKDGHGAILLDAEGEYLARLKLDHWYHPGSRTPTVGWVVEYLRESEMRNAFVAEGTGTPEQRQRQALEDAARAVINAEPVDPLEPALPASEFGDELDLLLTAWGQASDRLETAARRPDDHARAFIYVALSEVLSWTCTIDQVLQATWDGFSPEYREKVSAEVDAAVSDAIARAEAQAKARGVAYSEPPAAIFDAYRQRLRTGESYPYWSQALAIKLQDLDPRFLRGMHWVRGKFFHRGVLHAVDLRQWRPGAEPRWKWLPSAVVEHASHGRDRERRADYDAVVAGKDVLGSMRLNGVLLDTVWLFTRLHDEHIASHTR